MTILLVNGSTSFISEQVDFKLIKTINPKEMVILAKYIGIFLFGLDIHKYIKN
jgi:hypothetical protein